MIRVPAKRLSPSKVEGGVPNTFDLRRGAGSEEAHVVGPGATTRPGPTNRLATGWRVNRLRETEPEVLENCEPLDNL